MKELTSVSIHLYKCLPNVIRDELNFSLLLSGGRSLSPSLFAYCSPLTVTPDCLLFPVNILMHPGLAGIGSYPSKRWNQRHRQRWLCSCCIDHCRKLKLILG